MYYIDTQTKKISDELSMMFPLWENGEESLLVLSPHDDDAIIGAGYAIRSAIENGAKVIVMIYCRGNAGYSDLEQKDKIVEIRKKETLDAYNKLGLEKRNILYMDYSDFSVAGSIGWQVADGLNGTFERMIKVIRQNKITRVLIPNAYHEHIDHTAVNNIGSYDIPQAGDPILMDWGLPQTVKTIAEYVVWADLSPEDALVYGRDPGLRGNRILIVPTEVEELVVSGIRAYFSQGEIIHDMVRRRAERRLKSGEYIEVYRVFDPRPKLDYTPYISLAESLL